MPGKFHGQRSQAGYSPWSHRVGHDLVCVRVHTHTHTHRGKRNQRVKRWRKNGRQKNRDRGRKEEESDQAGGRIRVGGKKKPENG